MSGDTQSVLQMYKSVISKILGILCKYSNSMENRNITYVSRDIMQDEDREVAIESRLLRKRDFIILKDLRVLLKKMIPDYALLKQSTPWTTLYAMSFDTKEWYFIYFFNWLLRLHYLNIFTAYLYIYSLRAFIYIFLIYIYLFAIIHEINIHIISFSPNDILFHFLSFPQKWRLGSLFSWHCYILNWIHKNAFFVKTFYTVDL